MYAGSKKPANIMADNDSTVGSDSTCPGHIVSQTYDWTATNPSTAVIETVSVATNSEPTNLETLQHAIDADALDRLVQNTNNPDTFEIAFEYAGTSVLVTGGGTVRVTLE